MRFWGLFGRHQFFAEQKATGVVGAWLFHSCAVTYSYDIFDRTTKETYNNGVEYNYAYDASGTLAKQWSSTGEITGTTEYKYTTLSGKLVRVEYNTTILDIVYDESGQPFSIRYKSSPTATGALYYYVLNVQGDVVGLLNASGELVVEYKYDPWGKLLETIIGVDETDSKYAAYNNMGLRNPCATVAISMTATPDSTISSRAITTPQSEDLLMRMNLLQRM